MPISESQHLILFSLLARKRKSKLTRSTTINQNIANMQERGRKRRVIVSSLCTSPGWDAGQALQCFLTAQATAKALLKSDGSIFWISRALALMKVTKQGGITSDKTLDNKLQLDRLLPMRTVLKCKSIRFCLGTIIQALSIAVVDVVVIWRPITHGWG
jgi:hypothetical protein